MKSRITNPCHHFYHSPSWTISWHQWFRRTKKKSLQYLSKKYPAILQTVASILTITVLFICGAYFFFAQLAEYGW